MKLIDLKAAQLETALISPIAGAAGLIATALGPYRMLYGKEHAKDYGLEL